MKPRIALALSMLGMLIVTGGATAGIEKAGTTAANFLSVGSGAGILGMGGATLGWGGDLSAISWNTAALGWVDGTQVVISHASIADQTAQEWAAVGGRFIPLRTHWAVTGLYHGDGSFDGRDASGISTGTFGASSMALGAMLSRRIAGLATLGLGAKFVTEKLGDVTGTGGTFDAGLMVHAGPVGVGIAAQNVGGRMGYGGAFYPMPANYGIGGSFENAATGLRAALDFNFPSAYYSDVRTGLEWRWRDRLALRTGYRRELGGTSDDPLNGPTFGVGAGARGMWFDYGYLVGGNGAGQHRLGMTFHPGGLLAGGGESYGDNEHPKPAPEPRAAKPTVKAAPRAAAPEKEPAKTAAPAPSPRAEEKAAPPTAAPASTAPAAKATSTSISGVAQTDAKPTAPATTAKSTPAPAPPAATAAKSTPAPATPPVAASTPAPSATPKVAAAAGSAAPKPAKVAPAASTTPKPATAAPATTPASDSKLAAVAPASTPAPAAKAETKPAAEAKPETKPAAAAPAPTPAPQAKPSAPAASTPVEEKPAAPPPSVAPAPSAAPVTAAAPQTPRPAKVKVKKGETMLDIAKRWGTSPAAIMMENNLVTEKVHSGQTLKLPQR